MCSYKKKSVCRCSYCLVGFLKMAFACLNLKKKRRENRRLALLQCWLIIFMVITALASNNSWRTTASVPPSPSCKQFPNPLLLSCLLLGGFKECTRINRRRGNRKKKEREKEGEEEGKSNKVLINMALFDMKTRFCVL